MSTDYFFLFFICSLVELNIFPTVKGLFNHVFKNASFIDFFDDMTTFKKHGCLHFDFLPNPTVETTLSSRSVYFGSKYSSVSIKSKWIRCKKPQQIKDYKIKWGLLVAWGEGVIYGKCQNLYDTVSSKRFFEKKMTIFKDFYWFANSAYFNHLHWKCFIIFHVDSSINSIFPPVNNSLNYFEKCEFCDSKC